MFIECEIHESVVVALSFARTTGSVESVSRNVDLKRIADERALYSNRTIVRH